MQLTKGSNVRLGPSGPTGLTGLILGLSWDSGGLDCDACALVCGEDRRVLTDDHFLFWNNGATPERHVMLRSVGNGLRSTSGVDQAQVFIALAALPEDVDRVVLSLSTIVDGETLSQLNSLRLRALDPTTGTELASFEMGRELAVETCVLVGEVYRNRGDWKLRAIGAGYHSGLAGLGDDYGVNIT